MSDRDMATCETSAYSRIPKELASPRGHRASVLRNLCCHLTSVPGAHQMLASVPGAKKSAVSKRGAAPALMELLVQWTVIYRRCLQECPFLPSFWIRWLQAHVIPCPCGHRCALHPCCSQRPLLPLVNVGQVPAPCPAPCWAQRRRGTCPHQQGLGNEERESAA